VLKDPITGKLVVDFPKVGWLREEVERGSDDGWLREVAVVGG
jgi:hypothetical protein